MNYIVFDLEWNQSSDREGSVAHLPFEIIEIGAIKLDDRLQCRGEFHRLIRPQVYKTMHYKITEVTHLCMEELCRRGEPFPQAMREFLEWCGGEEYRFCTWGSMDLTELQRNMTYYGMERLFPMPLLYYDIQKLYCLQYGDGRTKHSLDLAVQEQEIPEERPFHRALDDAFYTGQVMAALDLDQVGKYLSVDYYRLPATQEEEFCLVFPTYSKYVSREFASREEAMQDKRVTDMVCMSCGRMMRKKIRWFSCGQRIYCGLGSCPEHGSIRGKIRVKHSESEACFVVKTMKPASEEDEAMLLEKREEGRRRRSAKRRAATPRASGSRRRSL